MHRAKSTAMNLIDVTEGASGEKRGRPVVCARSCSVSSSPLPFRIDVLHVSRRRWKWDVETKLKDRAMQLNMHVQSLGQVWWTSEKFTETR